MKRRTVLLSSAAAVTIGLLGVFQNCSKVNYASGTADLASLAQSTPLQVGESESLVSARNVPPLKLFFIVDNSYTMKANNLNLSKSFAKMFAAADNSSLARFDTTTYLISTAQRAPAWGSDELKSIASLQLDGSAVAGLDVAALSKFRTSTRNTGALPGDNLGYSLNLDGTGTKASFAPAMVLGAGADGQPSIGIRKLAADNGVALATEFQKRLALLDSGRIPLNSDGTQQNQAVLDAESGLCAAARILRDHQALVNPGEQAAFVIVSDEDENDPAGKACVASYENLTLDDPLINGRCEQRSTVLTYTTPTAGADTCRVTFKDGYQYKYEYDGVVKVTNITYRKQLSLGKYSSPTTTVNYFTKTTAYTKPVTNVSYFTKVCTDIKQDGLVTGQNCTFPPASGKVDGDQRGACVAAADTLSGGKAVRDDADHKITCPSMTTAPCTRGQPSCTGADTFFKQSPVVDGALAGDACVTKAKSYAGAIVGDDEHKIECVPAAAKTGDGACPSALTAAGCTMITDPTYAPDTLVQLDGDFSAEPACQNKAKTLAGGTGVDSANLAVCKVGDDPRKLSPTGTLTFASAADGGQTPLGECGALRAKVIAKISGAPGDGTCTLTSLHDGTPASVTPDAANACVAPAKAVCDSSNGAKTTCVGSFVPGAKGSKPIVLPAVTQEIACADLCAKSNNVLCAAAAGVDVNDQTTIAQYLIARYGAGTTCSVAVTPKTLSTFVDRKLSDEGTLCAGQPGVPQYLVKDDNGATHRVKQLVTNFVSGSIKDGTSYKPAVDLATYVNGRSQDLFGAAKPIVSVLVRSPADGVGEGGSIGKVYDLMAKVMGGRTDSIKTADYSSSLAALSGIINARLQRSFVVADMKSSQSVKEVLLRKAGSPDLIKLDSTQWSAAGNNVTIDASVALSPDDSLRFRYY